MKVVVIVAPLACLLMACGARVSGSGSRAQGIGDAATRVPDRSGVEDGGVPGVSLSDARPADDQASAPPDLKQGPTVWIGQSDMTVTYPPGYDGGTVVPDYGGPTGPEKVVLILNAVIDTVTGTITFGDVSPPPPPTDPNQPYPPAPTMLQGPNGTAPLIGSNWDNLPFPGFSYSLVTSTLTGNLLELAFVPAELWKAWCNIQDPSTQDASASSVCWDTSCDPFRPCLCDGGACTWPSDRLVQHLTLKVSGDTMQGQLLFPSGYAIIGAATDIRLQRAQ